MDEKIIYRLWRKYLAAARANTATEWKKYLLSCLRANVLPPIARGMDFVTFVDAIRYNFFEDSTAEVTEENEHEHE